MSGAFKVGNPGCESCDPFVLKFTALDCGGDGLVGATVEVSGPAGFSDTGTTAALGVRIVTVPGRGDYDWTVSSPGLPDCTGTTTVASCGTTFVPNCCMGGAAKVCGYVTGTCGAIAPVVGGIPYVVTQGGSTVASGTTDATGYYCACVPSVASDATVSVTSPPDRFGSASVVVPLSALLSCTTYDAPNLILPAASGYAYLCCGGCVVPLKDTLTVTDPVYGDVTLTVSNGAAGTTSNGVWTGTKTVSYTGCGTFPTHCCSVAGPIDVTITYEINTGGLGCGVTVTTPANNFGLACEWCCVDDSTPGHSTFASGGAFDTGVVCPPSWSATTLGIRNPVYCNTGSAVVPVTSPVVLSVAE